MTEKQKENCGNLFIMISQTAILLSILYLSLSHMAEDKTKEETRRSEMYKIIGDDEN